MDQHVSACRIVSRFKPIAELLGNADEVERWRLYNSKTYRVKYKEAIIHGPVCARLRVADEGPIQHYCVWKHSVHAHEAIYVYRTPQPGTPDGYGPCMFFCETHLPKKAREALKGAPRSI